MKTAKERYEHFFKNILTPFLKEKGFKRKGNRFVTYGKELAYAIYVARGKINDINYTSFAIYAEFLVTNFEEKNNPKIYKGGMLVANVSALVKNYLKTRITLRTEDEDAELKDAENAAYFLKAIEKNAIPFMEGFKTIRDVIHFLENLKPEENFLDIPTPPNVPEELAKLYWLLGEKEKAVEVLEEGLKKFPKNKYCVEAYTELKSRILKGGPVYTQP